jgi:hypothetical protein
MTDRLQLASCRAAWGCRRMRFAPGLLIWLLSAGLLVQSPAATSMAFSMARTVPASSQPWEEERPAESSEVLSVQCTVSQGRRTARVLTAVPNTVRMPLLNASGCMAACHHDGGRMLMCDVRLGSGQPLRL